MRHYEISLLKRETIAEGTSAFYFEKPQGFSFKPGQFFEITLLDPPETDTEGNTRAFSIASAPHEEMLMIATRMRDTAFKRVLASLPLGNKIKMEGPFGSFTLHNDTAKPAVFLMGGIGITPVRSIVMHAAHEKLPHQLFLFYSNRRPEDAVFLKELQNLTARNPRYAFIGTMTAMENSKAPWEGERGYISEAMLTRYVPRGLSPLYYSAGPQEMVAAMRKILNDARVDDDFIRTEEFSGY